LREGLPVEVAAERAGRSASTVRTWIRRGKREPTSEFGEFLRASEAAVEGEGAMTVEEVEQHLTQVIRAKKSVAAMALWVKLHAQEGAPVDEFSEFDPC
jgi:transposase